MGRGFPVADGVDLVWSGGLGVRGVVDGVTVAVSVMAAALPGDLFARTPGRAA